MAAAGRLVVQAVRPHAPMIKFPNRRGVPSPNVEEVLKSTGMSMTSSSSMISSAKTAPTQISYMQRPSGPPDSIATIRELPMKYRRRGLAVEEMDYIQRGGPE
ncbi:alpha-ketoglutarate dehydrogenase component 4-like [Sardina pilchardus]|uniref:alpha-ketoglutarate dehydrogenase component 4-like n=1 Tax=Sardina pilchardus TaxID=27697 RepID=UPI002E12E9E7